MPIQLAGAKSPDLIFQPDDQISPGSFVAFCHSDFSLKYFRIRFPEKLPKPESNPQPDVANQ